MLPPLLLLLLPEHLLRCWHLRGPRCCMPAAGGAQECVCWLHLAGSWVDRAGGWHCNSGGGTRRHSLRDAVPHLLVADHSF